MRKILLLVTIMFTMNIMMNAQTKPEMNGVGEYKFGLSKTECISILDKNNISHHPSKNDENKIFIEYLKIGGVIFNDAVFDFSNEGLYNLFLVIDKPNIDKISDLRKILIDKYGEPTYVEKDTISLTLMYWWEFENNNSYLFYSIDYKRDNLSLIYINKNMELEWKAYLRKKNNESF